MMKPALKWGLIGYGDLARKRVVDALMRANGSELVAVYGRNHEKTEYFAREFDIPQVCESVSDLTQSDIDAVYVCTPVDSHYGYAIEALDSGKHVLVEKPMAATVAECENLVQTAEQKGLHLGVAYYRRGFPKHMFIKEKIEEGFLGEPVWVNIVAHSWYNPERNDPKHWRVEANRSGGGGALADVGVHRLDLLRYWLGDFKVDYSDMHKLVHEYEVEDGCSVVFRLVNGAPVHAYFSWNSKTWMDRFEIVGSEGKLITEPLDGPDLVLINGREREEHNFSVPENAHLPCIESFVAAVDGARQPICTGFDGLFINRILAEINNKAEKSLATQ